MTKYHKITLAKREKIACFCENKHIDNRLQYINNRSEIGHAEGDIIFLPTSNSQNLITTIQRVYRMIKLAKNNNKISYSR